jgi:uncharacterized protein (DUF427 family)
VRDERVIIIRWKDQQVARTRQAWRILETASPPTFYIPRSDVNLSLLKVTAGGSFCEWKGMATYWSLFQEQQQLKDVGWSYEQPASRFQQIAGCLSFYPAKLQCTVDGQRVRPQPGGFYGGWVTDEIVGPFKGEPGTAGW